MWQNDFVLGFKLSMFSCCNPFSLFFRKIFEMRNGQTWRVALSFSNKLIFLYTYWNTISVIVLSRTIDDLFSYLSRFQHLSKSDPACFQCVHQLKNLVKIATKLAAHKHVSANWLHWLAEQVSKLKPVMEGGIGRSFHVTFWSWMGNMLNNEYKRKPLPKSKFMREKSLKGLTTLARRLKAKKFGQD